MLRNRIYYSVKPFVPRVLRTAVRRRVALGLRERGLANWPIMPGSECPPGGWPGWPNGKKFALVLTHDVEGKAGLDKCLPLAQLEREMGFRSSFNFVPEGKYRVPVELREQLVRDGFEVGVHDLRHDGRLYQSKREFSRNAARINAYLEEWGASGFRSGFMLHNLDWLHELKITYDMSTFDTDPFEPQPDGRHTIFPFLVPRPATRSGASVTGDQGYVELPYTLPQDSTLFSLLLERTPEIWLRKFDWIAHNGGMVLLNSHPDYMSFNGRRRTSMEYPVEQYQRLLDYIARNHLANCWRVLPSQVAEYVLRFSKQASEGVVAINSAGNSAAPKLVVADSRSPAVEKVDFANPGVTNTEPLRRLRGKRGAVLLFSHYPADPRPRRAAEALTKEGVTIDLICLQENPGELQRETVNGVNVLRVPLKRQRRGKFSYAWQYSAFIVLAFGYLTIRALLRRYDFVHVHNMPDILVFSSVVPKALGAAILLDLHDPMPELMQTIFNLPEHSMGVRLLKRLEKRSVAFADLVLTVNKGCKRIYSSRSCAPDKIYVTMNAPDDGIFQFRPSRALDRHRTDHAKPFLILYHGSLVQRNGFDLAVDALAALRTSIPQAKIVVCGARTPFFDTVMESARARGLDDSIEYCGPRNVHQIVEAIDACDVGIIPNHRNLFTEINTPTRIFEYLARGKPVIAPRAGGIEDYFGPADLIYFELGDGADLSRQIEYVFRHPQETNRIVERGQRVYLNHTWSKEKAGLLEAVAALV